MRRVGLFAANHEINISLREGAIAPTRAHDEDAGLDLYATCDAVVPAGGSLTMDTGVCVELPEILISEEWSPSVFLGTAGFLKSKSGLNVKYGIVSEGVIDCGYSGSIVVKLYNNGNEDYQVRRGDKITQLCIVPVLTPRVKIVDSIDGGERGGAGFGSSDRQEKLGAGRYTYKYKGEWCVDGINGKLISDNFANYQGASVDKLAAYEDTGLSPEHIQEAVDILNNSFHGTDIPKELMSWVERCTWHVRKCNELRDMLDRYEALGTIDELTEMKLRLEGLCK